MNKIRIVLLLTAIFSTHAAFAMDAVELSADSKPCEAIAKACTNAGFVRTENADKKFWQDCMKPVILGKSVKDVTLDPKTAKACRTHKIDELKKELKEFQKAS